MSDSPMNEEVWMSIETTWNLRVKVQVHNSEHEAAEYCAEYSTKHCANGYGFMTYGRFVQHGGTHVDLSLIHI